MLQAADIKVLGSDKLRFAVYESEDGYKLYVFNSDFNVRQEAVIIYKGEKITKLIDSVGVEIIELKK